MTIFGNVPPFVLVLASNDAHSIINGTIALLIQDNQIEAQHEFLVMWTPQAMASVSCDANGNFNGTVAFLRSK